MGLSDNMACSVTDKVVKLEINSKRVKKKRDAAIPIGRYPAVYYYTECVSEKYQCDKLELLLGK